MANFAVLRHSVTILVTDFTNQDNLTNDILISNSLIVLTVLSENRYVRQSIFNIFGQTSPLNAQVESRR